MLRAVYRHGVRDARQQWRTRFALRSRHLQGVWHDVSLPGSGFVVDPMSGVDAELRGCVRAHRPLGHRRALHVVAIHLKLRRTTRRRRQILPNRSL